MRVETPTIYWQGNSDTIMSIDFMPANNLFVTCGPDGEEQLYIRFWRWDKAPTEPKPNMFKMKKDESAQKSSKIQIGATWRPQFLYGDVGHPSPPNVVRFSTKGTYMASGGCDSKILIWDYKERYLAVGSTEKILKWGQSKSL